MTLLSIIRRFLPKKLKRKILRVIDKHPLLFMPVFLLLYRVLFIPLNEKKALLFKFPTEKILIYRDQGRTIFGEIFCYQVYEQFFEVKKGDKVIDVGANVGIFAIKAAKKTGNKGFVIAIEPEPNNLALLYENVKGFNNVMVVPKVAGNSKGKAKLYTANTSADHSIMYDHGHGYLDVEMDTLDNIILELKLIKVDFIKIDVEGAELEVLKGAEKLFKTHDVKIAIAAYHYPEEISEISQFLRLKGMNVVSQGGYIYATGRDKL